MCSPIFYFSFSDETAKWEKITYLGIASCTIFAFVVLSKPHPHYDEPPVSFLLKPWDLFLFCILLLDVELPTFPCILCFKYFFVILVFAFHIPWYAIFLYLFFHLIVIRVICGLCLQPYPYLHIRNKEFPWGMILNIISSLFSFLRKIG